LFTMEADNSRNNQRLEKDTFKHKEELIFKTLNIQSELQDLLNDYRKHLATLKSDISELEKSIVEKEQEKGRLMEVLRKLVDTWDTSCKHRDEMGMKWEELQLRHKLLSQTLAEFGGLEVHTHYEREHNKRVQAEVERLQNEYEQESGRKKRKLADEYEQEFNRNHETYNKRKSNIEELTKDVETLEAALKEEAEKNSSMQTTSTQLHSDMTILQELIKKANDVIQKRKSANSLVVRIAECKKKNQESLQKLDNTIKQMKEQLGIEGEVEQDTTVMLDEEIIRYRTLLELADFKLQNSSSPYFR